VSFAAPSTGKIVATRGIEKRSVSLPFLLLRYGASLHSSLPPKIIIFAHQVTSQRALEGEVPTVLATEKYCLL
jgi:hypothetical protein